MIAFQEVFLFSSFFFQYRNIIEQRLYVTWQVELYPRCKKNKKCIVRIEPQCTWSWLSKIRCPNFRYFSLQLHLSTCCENRFVLLLNFLLNVHVNYPLHICQNKYTCTFLHVDMKTCFFFHFLFSPPFFSIFRFFFFRSLVNPMTRRGTVMPFGWS